MDHRLTTAPAEEPISLEEAKSHLGVDYDDDDALIGALIKTARGHLDGSLGILGRCLVSQSWTLFLDGWPRTTEIHLPLAPVSEVTAIRYRDHQGQLQVVPPSVYCLAGKTRRPSVLLLPTHSWPTPQHKPESVEVEYVSGFGAAGDVPQELKHAMLLHIGTLYERRETVITGTIVAELPHAYDALVAPYRRRVL